MKLILNILMIIVAGILIFIIPYILGVFAILICIAVFREKD